jgi:alpha-L-fucosidase
VLYAIALGWPADGKITIRSLADDSTAGVGAVTSVQLLGSGTKLKWNRDHDGLKIELPGPKTGEYAWVFRIGRSAR